MNALPFCTAARNHWGNRHVLQNGQRARGEVCFRDGAFRREGRAEC